MAVDIKVVQGNHIVHQRAMGVYRSQEDNKLKMLHGSAHPDFNVLDAPVDEEGFVEVGPKKHVVWIS